MPSSFKNKPLTTESLAILFQHLYQMENSGIPAVQSLSLLKMPHKELNKKLARMQRQLKAGLSIAVAGANVGIFNATHQALIKSAESSGMLAIVYQQLANHYGDKLRRFKKMKSQLYLPTLMLLLALLIEPIPLLVLGKITFLGYLTQSVGVFLQILIAFFIFFKLCFWFEVVFQPLQLRTPIISKWIIKRQINGFLFILAVMMNAGVPFSEALPLAVATIKNKVLQKQFNPAIQQRHSGDAIGLILARVRAVSRPAIQIISVSEFSGNLPESLLHFVKREEEIISLQDDNLATWLPRLFYLSVCLWMAKSMLNL